MTIIPLQGCRATKRQPNGGDRRPKVMAAVQVTRPFADDIVREFTP